MKQDTAYISNDGRFTIFEYQDYVIRFLAPYSLERYIRVKEWDNGYIVVDAEYSHDNMVEEYIDLVPILDNLYFDSRSFLEPIKKVEVKYA